MYIMRHLYILFSILLSGFLIQNVNAQEVDKNPLSELKFRNIGPAGMSGRITAIDVNLRDKDHIYVGSASGGIWESKNGGITWDPIFDDQSTLSIGALEINQANPSEIWAGTGEGNPRNSHNSGAGVFKTVDGGKTWKCMGLEETKLIHRVIVNSDNPNTVLVGAMGSAWGASPHRGVYKTTDGGLTWKKTLYIGDNVGIADMVVDPSNPNKIIAAMWEFGRKPWTFNSGGKGSGMYISYDAGETWKKITNKEGLPKGNLGRMGLAFAPSNPSLVYALIEAKKNGLYKSTDGGENWTLVSTKDIGNRPFYYAEIYVDPLNENRIYNLWSYVSKSEDGGKTFKTIMDYSNNIHPDHHAFWIDPDDSNYLINGNDGGLNISRDGSKTWRFVTNLPVGQFYHVNVDDDFPYNVYGGMQDNGSWAGPGFVLRRGGITNYDWQELYFGDGFDVAPRKDDSRYGYAMSQQGYVGHYDKVTGRTEFIRPQDPEGRILRFHWNAALALDPFDDKSVYFGSQFVHKSSNGGKSWTTISEDLTTNDSVKIAASRVTGGLTKDVTGAENYGSILCIAPSPHDKDVIWAGTDDGEIQVTRNGGESWTKVNTRLPGMPKNAWVPQIVHSKINKGETFIVVNNYRQNDWSAHLYRTKDGGATFQRIINDKDVGGFVCSVMQDSKEEKLLFAGTDVGLYYSLNGGDKWTKWDKALPSVQVRDIAYQERFDDLVLGTFGRSFWILDDLAPLREMAQSANVLDKDFKVFKPGTAYLTSNKSYQGVRFVGQGDFKGENRPSGALLTVWNKPKDKSSENDDAVAQSEKGKDIKKNSHKKRLKGKAKELAAGKAKESAESEAGSDNKKGKDKGKDKVTIMVIDAEGDTIRTFKRKLKEGMNRLSWRPDAKGVEFPRRNEPKEKREPGGSMILPGDYKMVFNYLEHKDSTTLTVKLDPRSDESIYDPVAKRAAIKQFYAKVEKVTEAFNNLKDAKKSMALYDKIIAVQEDTIKKEFKSLAKDISGEIDSLMNLYILPESDKPEYRYDDETVNNYLQNARRFLGTSTGAPTPNGAYAIKNAEAKSQEVLRGINAFFKEDWTDYVEKIKALPLDIFKTYEAIRLD